MRWLTASATNDFARAEGVDQIVAASDATARTHSIVISDNTKLNDIRAIDLSGSSHVSSTGVVDLTGVTVGVAVTGVAAGQNTLTGGAGADTIYGGAGADIINVGTGVDTVVVGVGGAAGYDQVTGFANNDQVSFHVS